MSMSTKNLKSSVILFFLCSSFLLPSFKIGGINLYLTTIFSPLLFSYLTYKGSLKTNRFFFYILALGFMVFISSLYSNAIGLTTYSSRNYIESIKYLQYIPYLMALNYIKDQDVFIKTINVFSIFFITIFFIQWLNLLGLAETVTNLYLTDESSHIDDVLRGWRLTLTGAGPNEGAVIATFFFLYNLSLFTKKFKFYYLISAVILLLSIFMTQSRTALIGMMLAASIIILMDNKSFIIKAMLLLFTTAVLSFVFNNLELEYVKVGFETASQGDNNSLNTRFDRFDNSLDLFKKSPLFGYGPAKNELSTIIDSEYVLIIQRYGTLGILIFATFVVNLLMYGLKSVDYISGRLLVGYTFLTLIVMFTNNAYSGYQLFSITILLVIWVYSNKKVMQ